MTHRTRAIIAAGLLFAVVVATPGAGAAPIGSGPAPVVAGPAVLADLPKPEGDAADPQQVRQEAKDILARREYQPPEKSIGERIGDEVSKAFSRIINALSSGGAGSAFGWICILALLGGLVFLIVRVGRTVQRVPDHTPEVTVEVQRTPTEWRGEAERYEAAGDWKEALRCRYRAMVADLVDRSVLPDIPGRTVGEHRRDVQAAVPDATADFHGAAELFERAWYGEYPTGQPENEQFRTLSDRVVHRVDA